MTLPLVRRRDAVIDGAIAAERIVGTVVLLSRNGEAIDGRAAGFADREVGRPMREETVFRLASVTKLFAAPTSRRSASEHGERLRVVLPQPPARCETSARSAPYDRSPS